MREGTRTGVQEFGSSGVQEFGRLEAGSHGSVRRLPRGGNFGLWPTRFGGRTGFVPKGQHDRSQARSAWNHEENSSVPAGRLNRSGRTSSDPNFSTGVPAISEAPGAFDALSLAHAEAQFRRQISCGTDNDFGRPSGTEASLHRDQALRACMYLAKSSTSNR